jgi:glycolate oxidase FAD binding subunit
MGMSAILEVTDPVLLDFARSVGDSDPVTIVGGGTRWDLGGPVDRAARQLRAPEGIVTYTPAEMTVTVRAGTTVDALNRELVANRQRAALPERGGTVGGAVAVGEHHPDRRTRGTVAASVLQVRYVSAEGRLVTGGGPTVKNVTGFDLPRLMTGALGTLGLLVELILRTNPVPAVSRWVSAPDADPFAVSDQLLRPAAVLWDGMQTWVHLEGYGPDVDADQTLLGHLGSFAEVAGSPPLPPHRWSLEPAALRRLATMAAGVGADQPSQVGVPPRGPFVASVGVGTVWAASPAPVAEPDHVSAGISRRLKDNFDPSGRLNPGRKVGW